MAIRYLSQGLSDCCKAITKVFCLQLYSLFFAVLQCRLELIAAAAKLQDSDFQLDD